MIASPQITNTEVFGFKDVQVIVFIVFKLLSHKVLFINRKDSRKCKENSKFHGQITTKL